MSAWLLELALLAAALPVALAGGYLLLLSLAALVAARRRPPVPTVRRLRFDVVVPAHDEARGIAETVASLRRIDYPRSLFRVVVIADNCADDTAAVARAAGAWVMERHDEARRGKGHALAFAFAALGAEGLADAYVVVDADSVVSRNLLEAFAVRLEAGEVAVQARYGVRNPDASWRTRLMAVALALFHRARGLGREALGLSCGLRGNGMCFRATLLREVPHDAFSLVEDVEYGLRLGLVGYRVAYADEARVDGEMVSGEVSSRSQRRRWEEGRAVLAQTHGWPLLRAAVRARSALLLDLALDLAVPPLSRLVAVTVVGEAVALAALRALDVGVLAAGLFTFAGAAVAVYVATGWALSGTGLAGVRALAWAPAFLLWKGWLSVRRPATARGEWVRTTREGETRP